MEQGTAPVLAVSGTPANFVADDLGLDFLNSIASPIDVPVEWLGNGEAFVAWLRQAELVPDPVLEAMVEKGAAGRARCGRRAGPRAQGVVPEVCSQA